MGEGGRGRKFTCLKYFLMSSNAFGLMIGIFLVLFGMAYKEESFPGGYKGKETSGIAGVFIFVTLIGYCGAHHQKIYFLIVYSLIIFVFIVGNVTLWIVDPSLSMLDPESRTVYVVGGLFLILMVIGVFLSWKIRGWSRAEAAAEGNKNTDSPMEQSMTALGPPPPIPQKVNNNYNQQSSQQHHQQQQPAMTMVQHQYQSMHPSSSAQFVHQMVRGPPIMNPGVPGSFQ